MVNPKDYQIVYVDDEANALKYFQREFSKDFKISVASSAQEGWKILTEKANETGILFTDQRMPKETGVELLEKARSAYPEIVRIMVTAYADLESAISAVNSGAVYKYVSKPWDVTELRITLLRALEYSFLQRERKALLQEKLLVLQQVDGANLSKGAALLASGLQGSYQHSIDAVRNFLAIYKNLPQPNHRHATQVAQANTKITEEFYLATQLLHGNKEGKQDLEPNFLPPQEVLSQAPQEKGSQAMEFLSHWAKTQAKDPSNSVEWKLSEQKTPLLHIHYQPHPKTSPSFSYLLAALFLLHHTGWKLDLEKKEDALHFHFTPSNNPTIGIRKEDFMRLSQPDSNWDAFA